MGQPKVFLVAQTEAVTEIRIFSRVQIGGRFPLNVVLTYHLDHQEMVNGTASSLSGRAPRLAIKLLVCFWLTGLIPLINVRKNQVRAKKTSPLSSLRFFLFNPHLLFPKTSLFIRPRREECLSTELTYLAELRRTRLARVSCFGNRTPLPCKHNIHRHPFTLFKASLLARGMMGLLSTQLTIYTSI